MNTILKIAIQKSGRLNEDSINLFKECGIHFPSSEGALSATAYDFPVELLFLRNSDIPQYLEDSVADAAIIGQNTLVEKRKNCREVLPLGFSKCRLSLALPKSEKYTGIEYFQGKRIATSYPNTLKDFLDKNNINAEIHEISGSVEIAPSIGLADGIMDIVSSGSTLLKNGLKELDHVLYSQATLACSTKLSPDKQEILDSLIFRIKAVLSSKGKKYVLLNAHQDKLQSIITLLPGIKSPTITPLSEDGWYSVQTVIDESRFWEIIESLKACGAEGILVMPIEKLID